MKIIKALAADDENDKTAVDTITGVYEGGLDNLRRRWRAAASLHYREG